MPLASQQRLEAEYKFRWKNEPAQQRQPAPEVVEVRSYVTEVVRELFAIYMQQPDILPRQWRKDVQQAQADTDLARIVSDYIAGMTDRFALQEHERLTGRQAIPAGRRATPEQRGG